MEPTSPKEFKPYIAPEITSIAEFSLKAILLGIFFGILFGAATVYLALKAGLTVSASIPIAVLAISLGRKFFKTTILENNIIQTTGSAGESIAAGVVFTLPGFLFLSAESDGVSSFNYWTIFTLAVLGGILGTLMMIPLRRSLIVKEHGTLPYPEGTACASVLVAGEKGGDFAKTAFMGLGLSILYALLQKVLHLISEVPTYVTSLTNKYWPAGRISGEITPEYLGVGYIIGPKISGVLVAGGVLSSFVLIPLLATLVPGDVIYQQVVKLGFNPVRFGWDEASHTFSNSAEAIYRVYIRQIGAGAVAAGGFITLIKTIPTIISSFKDSLGSVKSEGDKSVLRTDRDLNIKVVLFGSLGLILLVALLPIIPGQGILSKLMVGVLVVIFGAFFVTVSSRIVGIIGSSNNPISGMTIATIMATCLVFIGVGWSGKLFEPMALVVGGMICIAAANAGATSQDLKTGYIIGATPKYQQLALFIGAVFSSIVIGWTVKLLDTPDSTMISQGIQHAIGEKYNAPQATLMATLIKGILSFNLDWQFVIAGVFLAIVMELCGIKALSFAVGAYLPLSTTLPIFAGGAVKGIVDLFNAKKNKTAEEDELGKGSLFATGLVAGGALAGVIVALLSVNEGIANSLASISLEHGITGAFGAGIYQLIGVLFFAALAFILFRIATKD
ncbi:MAG: oligopeptide transporter, OPT family [Saprospiraceae bacterium]|nr:oligopeptide transporter, OPT family [Saprospiraceae bacterium]MBK9222645.1 oligopeptide transporter, OPT family [Saprospiraceae bacterium]MBK9720310.1 oligopeptide transporter, OPT family [Saprospiraceae bacterium]MBK9727305.1 oligopeptide transporter, OPT family [Saprospiraceae bacterium]